jgi:hypothetical protein
MPLSPSRGEVSTLKILRMVKREELADFQVEG